MIIRVWVIATGHLDLFIRHSLASNWLIAIELRFPRWRRRFFWTMREFRAFDKKQIHRSDLNEIRANQYLRVLNLIFFFESFRLCICVLRRPKFKLKSTLIKLEIVTIDNVSQQNVKSNRLKEKTKYRMYVLDNWMRHFRDDFGSK